MSAPGRSQALMRKPFVAWPLSDRLAALIEQGLVSAANFVALVQFARTLGAADWGTFGFAYSLLLFAQGFQRALVTIPMVPFSTRSGWDTHRTRWLRGNTGLVLATLLLLLAAAAASAAAGGGWLQRSLLMAALLAPCVFLHEFARRAAVQERRFGTLAVMGAAYALVMLLASMGATEFGASGAATPWAPWGPALAFAGAAVAAAVAYRVVTRRSVAWVTGSPPAPAEAGYGRFGAWALASHLGYSGYNFGVQAILAALAGPAAVGAFHACRTLVQPVAVLMTAIDSIDKPRAAAALQHGGWPALRNALLHNQRWAALLVLPFLAGVALAAAPALRLFYGELYATQQAVVWMACLAALAALVAQPVESGLYVARRTRELFLARCVAAVLGLASAGWLVPLHGASGACAAVALGFAVAATFGAFFLFRCRFQLQ
jgi:O-antigen/teichoic acid export membrane protein